MKNFFSNSAFLSALLIFVGYLNVYIYYNEFGINISTYLTTGELLLSFLPLTIPLLILASFFFIPTLDVLTTESGKSRKYESRVKEKELFRMAVKNLTGVWKILRQKRVRRPILLFFFTILEIVRLAYGTFYYIFLVIFLLPFSISVFASDYRFPAPIAVWIFFTLLWYVFLDDQIKKKDRDIKAVNDISVIVVGVLFLGLVSIYNKDKAFLVLSGRQDFKVSFQYDTMKVETDSNLVYIGKTNEYLFLRDRSARKNKIYPIDKVSLLEYTDPKPQVRSE